MSAEAIATPLTDASDRLSRPLLRPSKVLMWSVLMVGGLLMVLPFIFMVSTSLKFNNEIYELSLLPKEPTWSNYQFLFEETRFFRWFVNSLIIATITTVSVLFFDSLVGYTLAKFKFRGRIFVFVAILSTLMIPTEMLIIPWFLLSRDLGWLDSYWGIMFPGMMTGFGTFLMKQFFESVPDDFLDAARIDGLNEFQIWWEVAMPLVKPALAALAIFIFLGNWTAFLWPLIVTTSEDLYTIPVGFAAFSGEFTTDWELIMTGATVATLPTLLIFIMFQKFIIRGVMLTGLKG